MRACRTHLHLQGPTVSFFTHVESLQSITTNRAERTHVGRAHAVEQAQKGSDQVSGKHLMPVHASSLAPTTRTRRNHEIMRPFNYRLDQPIHHFRIVTAVAVKKHDDFAISREQAQSGTKRPPVSSLRLCHDASSGCCCNFGGAIGAAVINDDY